MGKYKVVSDHMEYLMNICEKHGPCRRAGRPPAALRAPLSICRFSRFSLDWAGNLNPRCTAELSTTAPVDNFAFYPQVKSLKVCEKRNAWIQSLQLVLSTENCPPK
jgi:hypothetical protein